jgi:hypothetical protein
MMLPTASYKSSSKVAPRLTPFGKAVAELKGPLSVKNTLSMSYEYVGLKYGQDGELTQGNMRYREGPRSTRCTRGDPDAAFP